MFTNSFDNSTFRKLKRKSSQHIQPIHASPKTQFNIFYISSNKLLIQLSQENKPSHSKKKNHNLET